MLYGNSAVVQSSAISCAVWIGTVNLILIVFGKILHVFHTHQLINPKENNIETSTMFKKIIHIYEYKLITNFEDMNFFFYLLGNFEVEFLLKFKTNWHIYSKRIIQLDTYRVPKDRYQASS